MSCALMNVINQLREGDGREERRREKGVFTKSKQLKFPYSQWHHELGHLYLLATHGNIDFVLFLILFLTWFLL